MATDKKRITVTLEDDQYEKMVVAMEDLGIQSISGFASKAINNYLAKINTDEESAKVIGHDTVDEIKKALVPIMQEKEETNRVLMIMLDVLWRKLIANREMNQSEVESLVRSAVDDINSYSGITPMSILSAGKEEIKKNKADREIHHINISTPQQTQGTFDQNSSAHTRHPVSTPPQHVTQKHPQFSSDLLEQEEDTRREEHRRNIQPNRWNPEDFQ